MQILHSGRNWKTVIFTLVTSQHGVVQESICSPLIRQPDNVDGICPSHLSLSLQWTATRGVLTLKEQAGAFNSLHSGTRIHQGPSRPPEGSLWQYFSSFHQSARLPCRGWLGWLWSWLRAFPIFWEELLGASHLSSFLLLALFDVLSTYAQKNLYSVLWTSLLISTGHAQNCSG